MTELYLSQEEFQDIFKNHLKIEVYSKPIESLFSVRSPKKSTSHHTIRETTFGMVEKGGRLNCLDGMDSFPNRLATGTVGKQVIKSGRNRV